MHSAELELTKLTYTRLEDNLIRHRGDPYRRMEIYSQDRVQGEAMITLEASRGSRA